MALVHPLPEASTRWDPGRPVDLGATLGPLRRGGGDPAYRVEADGSIWRATLTPEGAATVRLLARAGEGVVEAAAWGTGAAWAIAGVPRLLGGADDPEGFSPRHPLLAAVAARYPGWRVPRTGLVMESLVPAVLEQKVTGTEARRAWRHLLYRYGARAPGPAPIGMRVPPPPAVWARVPSWEWHLAGVDSARSRTVTLAARVAGRLEQSTTMPAGVVPARLCAVPGIGPWTAAEVRQRAHGDPDAVSVGDFHLPALVGWALAGRPVDDAGMLELLAPYAGHRYRAVRLVELSGFRVPRFGPRLAPHDHRAR